MAFAHTLRHIQLGRIDGCTDASAAVLAQLFALETVTAPGLPNAACFLAGQHTRLREITARCVHSAAAGASLSALVRACPRLVKACGGQMHSSELPAGWTLSMPATACRMSFAHSWRPETVLQFVRAAMASDT